MAQPIVLTIMSTRIAVTAIGLAAAGMWIYGGSAQVSQTFDVPADQLIDRIKDSHRIVEGSGMGSLTLAGEGRTKPDTVKISVMRAGNPHKVICLVTVAPQSETTTRADLDCTQQGTDTDQAKSLGGEAIAIVVAEHVNASALRRPYDTDKVANQMLAFMAKAAPVLAGNMQAPPDVPHKARPATEQMSDVDPGPDSEPELE